MARDEAMDVGISSDSLEVRMWPQVDDESRFARYVPHSQLAALESKNAELRKRVEELEDELRRVVSGDCSGRVREFERTRACNLCKRMCRDVFEAKP